MKYPHETEEQFRRRQEEAEARGECVFRDDANREFILDIIDDYIDVAEAITPNAVSTVMDNFTDGMQSITEAPGEIFEMEE